jgi:putative spermidine/putrescine transport system substrate-binding protein
MTKALRPQAFCLGTLFTLACSAFAPPAAARDLTWVSFGGALQDAIRGAFVKPFTETPPMTVLEDSYTGAMSSIAAQVIAKHVTWDVVDVNSDVIRSGCEQGYFEKLDWSALPPKDKFLPAAVNNGPCGIGFLTGAIVLGYDAAKFPGAHPESWADFWDIQKFPGKRALRQDPRFTLEIALMADGVKPQDLYTVLAAPAGIDRAFKKLDALKPFISWWTVGAQSVQQLASGEVVMSGAYSGRLIAANNSENKQYVLDWDAGSIYFHDYWGIVKGSPNTGEAMKFVASTMDLQRQLAFAKASGYGPTLLVSGGETDASLLPNLLTPERLQHSVARDDAFWTEHGDELTRRFQIWAAK